MIQKRIDSKNFDKNFENLLKTKKGKNILKGRFDIESSQLVKKIDFIIYLLSSIKLINGLTYKILFWEEVTPLQNLIECYIDKKYIMTIPYKNGKLPGVIFIDDKILDELFLKELLTNHFNYELAKDPSLNLRVQICVNQEDYLTLLDIYDDRGFDTYYVEVSKGG
jgi:hypothetical protein